MIAGDRTIAALARHNHHHQVIPGPRSFQALYLCPPYHILGLLWITTQIFQDLRLAWTGWFALGCGGQLSCATFWTAVPDTGLYQECSGFPMRCLRPPSPQFSMPWLELGILKGGVPRSSGERLHLFYGMWFLLFLQFFPGVKALWSPSSPMRQQYFLPYQQHRAGWCQEWANAGCWNETSCYWPGYNCGEWRWTEKIQLKPDSWSAGDSRLCVPGFSVFLSKLSNLVLFTYCPIAYWHLLVRIFHTILHIRHDATWILGKQVIASQLVLADCRILPRCPLGWHLRCRSKMGQQFEACNNTIACCLYMRWIKNSQAPQFFWVGE